MTLIGDQRVKWLARLILAGMGAWLATAVVLVNLELDDGYATIINSQYFLGISDGYFWQRGPMLAWLLMPAEYLANLFDLPAFAVWPHHALTALMHLGYVVGVWWLLTRHYGTRAAVLLGFVAAIPSVVFFSYAPFISHDILPGLLLLSMLFIADEYVSKRKSSSLVWLVVIGVSAILIKQTYAVFWLAVGAGSALSLQLGEFRGRKSLPTLLQLAAAALVSVVIAWLIYSWVLLESFGPHPFLLGPLLQYQGILENVQQGGPLEQTFYPWLYLRNLSAYGFLAMALVLPGAWLCLRSRNPLAVSVALSWLILALLMQLLKFKEVRYLEYLAPLTAFLVVAAIDAIVKFRRNYRVALLLLLSVDAYAVVREAMRIDHPFYGRVVDEFLGLFPAPGEVSGRVIISAPLTFVSPDRYAFQNDRFHRITHINADQVRYLRGYALGQMARVEDETALDTPAVLPGSIVIFSNSVPSRRPPFRADNLPQGIESFSQSFTVAERIDLVRDGDEYVLQQLAAQPVLLLRAPGASAKAVFVSERIAAASIASLRGLESLPERLTLLGFRVRAYCDISGCR